MDEETVMMLELNADQFVTLAGTLEWGVVLTRMEVE